ncbi:MAG TPA: hypothetical protein VD905_06835 [Flavobacteriales bacterium]|nr:hypothetical protein [Flavobacteriales bacterium]
MSFFQKVKIILQVLFICGLFLLNAAVYQKYNYFAPARHLSYIPKTTVLSITLNTNKLNGGAFYNFLYKNEEFKPLLEDEEFIKTLRQLFKVSQAIDITNQLSIFFTNNSSKKNFRFAGILCDITSSDNTITLLEKEGFKQNLKGEKTVYRRNESQYAIFNNEVVAFIHFKDSTYSIEEKLVALKSVITENSENKTGKAILPYLEKGNQVVVYSLPENISKYPVWMEYFVACGNFKDDAFEFDIDLKFQKDISSYFPEHKVNTDFNFDNIDGYLYFKSTLHATNATLLLDKLSFIKLNDSIENIFRPVLHNQLAKGIEFYCYNLNKAELKVKEDAPFELKILSQNFVLPAFDFRLNCSNPKKIDTLLFAYKKQNKIIQAKDNWFLWERDQHYKVYFGVKNDWLNITTEPSRSDQLPETGYSNVFYFNSDNFNNKLPNMQFRMVADEKKYFDSFLVYATGASRNILHLKGKLVLKREHDGLIESLDIMFLRAPRDLEIVKPLLQML